MAGIAVGVVVVLGVVEDVEDLEDTLGEGVLVDLEGILILLRVMSMGFTAIWCETGPSRRLSLVVVAAALPQKIRPDPGSEAKAVMVEEVDGKFGWGE